MRQHAHSSSCCHAGHADCKSILVMHDALLSSLQAAGVSVKLLKDCVT
jgi:hypothetical protein